MFLAVAGSETVSLVCLDVAGSGKVYLSVGGSEIVLLIVA